MMNGPIDRASRNQAAELIRHFSAGLVTNDEFEDRYPAKSNDIAIREISHAVWHYYSDIRKYKLVGDDRLTPQSRDEFARMILFLKSDLPYEWPHQGLQVSLFLLPVNLLTLGCIGWLRRKWFASHGDIAVWPFIRNDDFASANNNGEN
jgi:hypothetical protein